MLGAGSDLYVLNRGNNSIVRINQAGQVLAARRISRRRYHLFRVNGIAVSENAQTIWVTAVMSGGRGVVLQMPAFGAGVRHHADDGEPRGCRGRAPPAPRPWAPTCSPPSCRRSEGVGASLQRARLHGDCHNDPIEGAGWARRPRTFVTRVGRIDNEDVRPRCSARADSVARAHSIAGLGFACRASHRRSAAGKRHLASQRHDPARRRRSSTSCRPGTILAAQAAERRPRCAMVR